VSFRSKSVGWLGGLTRGLLLLLVRPVVLRMYLGTTFVLVADLGVTSCVSGLRAMDSCSSRFPFRFVFAAWFALGVSGTSWFDSILVVGAYRR